MCLETENAAEPLRTPYVFGASVVGPLHVRNDLPCQDACSYQVLPSGWVVIAVADGLGSARRSEVGAVTAVTGTIEGIRRLLAEPSGYEASLPDAARNGVYSARAALETKASELGLDLRELACTMIVVVGRARSVSVAHVGDGAVVGLVESQLILLSGPGESEYVNEVVPLTADSWEAAVRVTTEITGLQCVAAFTDGCQRAALLRSEGGLEPFARFFLPLFAYAQEVQDVEVGSDEIAEFLSSERLNAHFDDDKTLVVAVLDRGERSANNHSL